MRSRLLFAAALVAGCSARHPEARVVAPPRALPTVAAEGVTLEGEPDVRVTLKAPSRAPYAVDALGPIGRGVTIRLANRGSHPVDVERLLVSFDARREGVSFPCVEASDRETPRESRSIAPGETIQIERAIRCAMPLPGRYEIAVYASVRPREERSSGSLIGTVSLDVASSVGSPIAHPARPGLHVVAAAGRAMRPISKEAWYGGAYRIAVVFVNAGPDPVRVGRASIAFLTYRVGVPTPCGGRAERLLVPESLRSGQTYVTHAPLSCAPSEEGRYEIVARLVLDDEEGVVVGRFGLTITTDPSPFSPSPWPTWTGRSAPP